MERQEKTIELKVTSKFMRGDIAIINVERSGSINKVEYHFFRNGITTSEGYEEFKNLEKGDKLMITYDSVKQGPSRLVKIERSDGGFKIYPEGAAPIISMTYIKKSKSQ